MSTLSHAYSLLYYETRIKDVVIAEWPAERERILEQKKNGEHQSKYPHYDVAGNSHPGHCNVHGNR
jgi:hypothetical protein